MPVVKIVITLVMSPLIVKALGNYDYGIWEMVFAVVGYMGILDLGLTPAIIRYVARHQALEDRAELNRIFSSAMAFMFPVGFAMALALVGIAFFAPQLIIKGTTDASQSKYFIFLLIVAVQTFVDFIGSLFDSFLEGFQKYALRNYATVFMSVAGAIVIYPLLKNGGGLLTIAAANAVGYTIKYSFYGIMLASNRFGSFRFRMSECSLKTLKGMFSFGFNNLIYSISLRLSTVTDSLVIGAFLGPSVVTLYIIPYNFISQARTFIWALSRNFMPLFSELDALGHAEAARKLYFQSSRIMVGIILPLVVGIVMLGPAFLEHWMGVEYAREGRYVLYIIVLAYGIQWLNPLANRMLTGYGQHGIMAKIGIISSFFNLAISLLLVQFVGKEGVALGTLLPVLFFEPLYLYKVCKILDTGLWGYARQVLMPLLLPVFSIMAGIALLCRLHAPESLPQVVGIAVGGMLLYLPTFWLFGLRNDERNMLLQKIGLQKVMTG